MVQTSETSPKPTGPVSVDILAIYVPPGIGNAVKLVWGDQRGNEGLNLSYGVYYGMDQGELEFPKTVTPNQSAIVKDLEFCTRYHFAVTMLNENDANQEVNINPNTIRTVITGLNHTLAPLNLTVELEPKARPCLDIKWSAACPNVISPIGYVISILDVKLSKYNVVTLPRTKRSDMVYRVVANYGGIYEIRVSTTFPGSKAVGPLTYQVPEQLQPFKVKVTVNKDDDAFMIYWTEPYVPLSIGRYYYQISSSPDNVTKMMQRYLVVSASFLLISTTFSQPTTSSRNATVNMTVNSTAEVGQDTVIELKDMTPIEYVGKRLIHVWNELGTEEKVGKSQGFVGRCLGVAKKIKQLLPFLMFGGGVIMTKLGFLVLFSLKTVGLLLLLVIFQVAGAALKAGAFFAHKKGNDSPLHVHVQGEHDHGPSHIPYGWDDRRDSLEGHDLYNMYEKLKRENALLKRYYSP